MPGASAPPAAVLVCLVSSHKCRKLVRSILILGSEVIVNVYGHRVKAFFRTRSSGQGSFLAGQGS